MAEGIRGLLSAWEEYRVKADECQELDDERVLALVQYSGRGKTSGLELERMGAKAANVFHLRDGKMTRMVVYFDRERALADLGLSSDSSRT
jgi:ketosteroid isomerase-like protein